MKNTTGKKRGNVNNTVLLLVLLLMSLFLDSCKNKSYLECNRVDQVDTFFDSCMERTNAGYDRMAKTRVFTFDSICIIKMWQGEGWRMPDLHFCIDEDTVSVFSDSVNLAVFGISDVAIERKKQTLFPLMSTAFKREEVTNRIRKPMEGDYMLDYNLLFYKEGKLLLDTTLFYGADYQYLTDEMLLFINNLNSISAYYNSILVPNFRRPAR